MNVAAMTHDPAEIARFESTAARWWDPEGEFRPLHDLNPVRLSFIEQRAPLAGLKVLDVGCGGGLLSEAMARRGANVTGIDLGQTAIEVAALHALEAGVKARYLVESAEAHAARNAGTYDVVTCLEMLEHVPEPGQIIATLATLVRPGGHVFLSTLNRTLKAYLLAVVGAEYIARLLPKGTHTYERFIRPAELAAWCRAAGIEVRDMAGIEYHPLARTARLVTAVDTNYILNGIRSETALA
jgi:2-polyprenyl-6-hydroxyphenyl methylase / 3-demethylubiquinone-9 3-methyltransferase